MAWLWGRARVWLFCVVFCLTVARLAPAAEVFVAPDGDDSREGTREAPFASIQRAQQAVGPGDTVWIRGGRYRMGLGDVALERRIWAYVTYLDKSGEPGRPIRYWAVDGETPVFDFAAIKHPRRRVHAFEVAGSWLHFKGIEVVGVQVAMQGHTQSICFSNNGSHNIYEQLSMHDGHAIGIYSVRGAHNLFLNCDAYNNHDTVSEGGRGGNTDGFGCHPPRGATGNVFRGCRAWFNSDDGFDCISAEEAVTFEQCWAYGNGYSPEFRLLADGNGFKVGGYGSTPAHRLPNPVPRHTVVGCVAARNKANGFYGNHHIGGSDWLHNSASRNAANYNFLSRLPDNVTDVPGYGHVIRNNLSHGSRRLVTQLGATGNELVSNSFDADSGVEITDADFLSLEAEELLRPRSANGELPEVEFLQLAPGSDLAGLGAFEQPVAAP
ncbi:MAG: right-handed parallel beta-helix repeat-containing protein [Planctomycetaceae bacterium]